MSFSNLKQLIVAILGSLLIIGCGGGNTSRGTGWDINSKKGGFQYNTEFNDPVKEVQIGNEILKSLNLRERGVKIISCPSCARQGFEVIETVKILEKRLSHIKTPITLSVIGCVVNGPGEAAMTDVGITGGKKGNNMLYLSGVQSEKVLTKDMIEKIVSEVEKKASELKKS